MPTHKEREIARRVWIVSKETEITQEVIDAAKLNGCPWIANGIPPALQDVISEKQLPCAYEEPESEFILGPGIAGGGTGFTRTGLGGGGGCVNQNVGFIGIEDGKTSLHSK